MNCPAMIKRTNSNDPDFQRLVAHLDRELWDELNEDQVTYDQYNKVPDLTTVVVLYEDAVAVASGCFKKYNGDTVEIKRMFVEKEYRGKGYSKMVLDELEHWAIECGYQYAILETSVHFKPARTLYSKAGYHVIENYDQYKGLNDSICMQKELGGKPAPSEFVDLAGIEYFDFEEDFVEHNMRCIPMIVRFKMDKAGIKLKLAEWSKFKREERIGLALMPCTTPDEIKLYSEDLIGLIKKYTDNEVTFLEADNNPEWADLTKVPAILENYSRRLGHEFSSDQWKTLTNLQRFALIKLCKEGHENRNLPRAMQEFKII